ncbi:MAG: FAD-dependent oxidoreductase [Romboutsia sp.]
MLSTIENYVILGASAAGINAAKTLKKLNPNCNIVIISKDDKTYSRCMLHHVISNHKTVEEIDFVEKDFIKDNYINWIKNKSVKSIDFNLKIVELDDINIEYDKLLIATGASAFIPPIKKLKNGKYVYPLRDIDDVYKIKEKAKNSKKAVVIGAGLVGIDALNGLMNYENLEVSLVNTSKYILDKQLDEYSAMSYEKKFIENGANIYNGLGIREIILNENNDVLGLELENGNIIECDMIVVATGVRPNANFIDTTKIEYDRGIVINKKCETSQSDVYAAGDVVGKNSIWPLAVKQGITAAYNMLGVEKEINDSFSLKNSMNFMGIATVSLGMINPIDDSYNVVSRRCKSSYKKFIYKNDIIYGAIAQGDISYIGTLTYLIKNKIEILDLKNRIFDIGYADFLSLKDNGEFCYNV